MAKGKYQDKDFQKQSARQQRQRIRRRLKLEDSEEMVPLSIKMNTATQEEMKKMLKDIMSTTEGAFMGTGASMSMGYSGTAYATTPEDEIDRLNRQSSEAASFQQPTIIYGAPGSVTFNDVPF